MMVALVQASTLFTQEANAQSSVGPGPAAAGPAGPGGPPGGAPGPGGSDSGAGSFGGGFTDRATASANGDLSRCLSRPKTQRIRCVAKALDRLANRLSVRSEYGPVARVFRRAAKRVRAARTITAALRILTSVKKRVLRSYGDKLHVERLATVVDKAKSVLRY